MNKNKTIKEILSLKNIKIYHGSDIPVKEPKIRQPVMALDFGNGFYTTTNRNQAKSFAAKVKDRNRTADSYISIYSLDLHLLKKMDCLVFNTPDKRWLDFVSANRNGTYEGVICDVIYGPVANDTIFRTFIAYQNGILNEEETLKRLKIRELFNQLVFTNEKSLKCFSFSGESKD